jgi:hypothetical protein
LSATSTAKAPESPKSPTPKRPKVQWQETLIALIAAQQDQLAQLSRQSNTTPSATRSVDTAHDMTSHTTSFRLAEFNPDTTNYPMEEWLEIATKLKVELLVGDTLMIVKVGEALKGRAHEYYVDWRPVQRTWEEFCSDLTVAFPNRETPGARAYTATTLRSRDCTSLSDYGIQKLRTIHRFHSALPWNTILSMVEYGLDHSEAQAAIHIQQPSANRELLKLLTDFNARQRKHQHRATQSGRSHDVTGANSTHKRRPSSSATPFKGTCFSCGRSGHRQVDCRASVRDNRKEPSKDSERKRGVDYPTCDHCKRPGHTEGACWQKHGKPKNIMLFRRGRNLASTPVATLLYDDKAANFPYLIDSGADVSILCESAATKLGAPITPEVRLLSGIGTRHVYSSGTCYLVAVLPTVTLKVLFTIVADDTIPGNLSCYYRMGRHRKDEFTHRQNR